MTPADQGHGAGGADPREGGPTGPVIRDKRRVDPKTGEVRQPAWTQAAPGAGDGATADSVAGAGTGVGVAAGSVPGAGADVGVAADPVPAAGDVAAGSAAGHDAEAGATPASADPAGDPTAYATGAAPGDDADHPDTTLAAERLDDLRRLQAEFVNYRRRIERDRARDRAVAVSGVVEALLPVLDDIHSAREHGDLTDGPFAAIAVKLQAVLGRFGVEQFGQVGDAFDPALHEALLHLSDADVPEGATDTTVVQVMQPGFTVGERVVRAARVAVADPG